MTYDMCDQNMVDASRFNLETPAAQLRPFSAGALRRGAWERSRTLSWISSMVSRSILMLAALGARTSAFHTAVVSRTGHWNALRRITPDSVSRTQVGRLAVESAAVGVEVPTNAADTTNDVATVKSPFLQTLVERGFYHQCTNVEGLDDKLLTGEAIKAYLGFDATADRYVAHVVCCVSSVEVVTPRKPILVLHASSSTSQGLRLFHVYVCKHDRPKNNSCRTPLSLFVASSLPRPRRAVSM